MNDEQLYQQFLSNGGSGSIEEFLLLKNSFSIDSTDDVKKKESTASQINTQATIPIATEDQGLSEDLVPLDIQMQGVQLPQIQDQPVQDQALQINASQPGYTSNLQDINYSSDLSSLETPSLSESKISDTSTNPNPLLNGSQVSSEISNVNLIQPSSPLIDNDPLSDNARRDYVDFKPISNYTKATEIGSDIADVIGEPVMPVEEWNKQVAQYQNQGIVEVVDNGKEYITTPEGRLVYKIVDDNYLKQVNDGIDTINRERKSEAGQKNIEVARFNFGNTSDNEPLNPQQIYVRKLSEFGYIPTNEEREQFVSEDYRNEFLAKVEADNLSKEQGIPFQEAYNSVRSKYFIDNNSKTDAATNFYSNILLPAMANESKNENTFSSGNGIYAEGDKQEYEYYNRFFNNPDNVKKFGEFLVKEGKTNMSTIKENDFARQDTRKRLFDEYQNYEYNKKLTDYNFNKEAIQSSISRLTKLQKSGDSASLSKEVANYRALSNSLNSKSVELQKELNDYQSTNTVFTRYNQRQKEREDFYLRKENDEFSAKAQNFLAQIPLGITESIKSMVTGIGRISNSVIPSDNLKDFLDLVSEQEITIGNAKISPISERVKLYTGSDGNSYENRNGTLFKIDENGKLSKPDSLPELTFKENRTDFKSSGIAFMTAKFGTDILLTQGVGKGINALGARYSEALAKSNLISQTLGAENSIAKGASNFANILKNPTNATVSGWYVQMYNDNYRMAEQGGIKTPAGKHMYAAAESFIQSIIQRINPDTNFLKAINSERNAIVSALMNNNLERGKLLFGELSKKMAGNVVRETGEEIVQQVTQDFNNTVINKLADKNLRISDVGDYKDVIVGTIIPSALASLLGGSGSRNATISGQTINLDDYSRNELITELARDENGLQLLKDFEDDAYFKSQKDFAQSVTEEIQTRQKYIDKIPDNENHTTKAVTEAIPLLQQIERKQKELNNSDGTFTTRLENEISDLQSKVNLILDNDINEQSQSQSQQQSSSEAVQEQNPEIAQQTNDNAKQEATPINDQYSLENMQTLPFISEGSQELFNSSMGMLNDVDWNNQENVKSKVSKILDLIANKPIPESKIDQFLESKEKFINSKDYYTQDYIEKYLNLTLRDFSGIQESGNIQQNGVNQDLNNNELEPDTIRPLITDESVINRLKEAGIPDNVINSLPSNFRINDKLLMGSKGDSFNDRFWNTIENTGQFFYDQGETGNKEAKPENPDVGRVDLNRLYKFVYGQEKYDKTLFHEAVHGATILTMFDMARQNIQEGSAVFNKYSKEEMAAYENLKWYPEYYRDIVANGGKIKERGVSLYGLSNEYEFVAEFLSNNKFREWLVNTDNEIEGKRPNILRRIWDNILEILGSKSKTVSIDEKFLKEVNSDIETILRKQRENLENIQNGKIQNNLSGDNNVQESAPVTVANENIVEDNQSIKQESSEADVSKTNLNTLLNLQNETVQRTDITNDGPVGSGIDSIQQEEQTGAENTQDVQPTIEPVTSEADVKITLNDNQRMVSDNVIATIDQIELPDGTDGFRVTVTDQENNPILDRNEDYQFEFGDMEDVDKFINQKQKGYSLQKNNQKQRASEETTNTSNQESNVGKNVTFSFLGDDYTGRVVEGNKGPLIEAADGTKYNPTSKQVTNVRDDQGNPVQFQASNDSGDYLSIEEFVNFIDKLKIPFKKAFGNVDVLFDWNDFVNKANSSNIDLSTIQGLNEMPNIPGVNYMSSKGSVYGAKLPDGTIYIDNSRMNYNTPIHEFSHLWEQLMPSRFKKGVEILKQTKTGKEIFNKLKEEGNYGQDENALWNEALNTHIGNYGEWSMLKPKGKMGELLQWVKDFFAKMGQTLGVAINPNTELRLFTDEVLGDLTSGKVLTPESSTTQKNIQFSIKNGNELLPVQTVTDVVTEIQNNGIDSGLKKLQESDWFKGLSQEQQSRINTNNLVSELIGTEQERQQVIENSANERIKISEESNKTEIKDIKQSFRDKISEMKKDYTDLKSKFESLTSAKERLSEKIFWRKKASNSIKSLLTDKSIKDKITPSETASLIGKADKIMNARDVNKVFDEFQSALEVIVDRAENRSQTNKVNSEKAFENYNSVKEKVQELINDNVSLSEILKFDSSSDWNKYAEKAYYRIQNESVDPKKATESVADLNREEQELINRKTPFVQRLKKWRESISKNTFDRQWLPKKYLTEIGAVNTENRLVNMAGSASRGKMVFEKAYDNIFKGLSKSDRSVLDNVIQQRRIISIDNNREERSLVPIDHPKNMDKFSAMAYLQDRKVELGDKKYNDLIRRSDNYFSEFNKLLTDIKNEGLINQESYDSMNGLNYEPRVFLEHLLDYDKNLSSEEKQFRSETGGLSKDVIRSLDEGSTGILLSNAELLLATAIGSRYKAIMMNRVNREFINEEFPKAKQQFESIDPNKVSEYEDNISKGRSVKTKEERFYRYFKELDKKIIDNPIIGVNKNLNPTHLYDKTPQGYKKAYYFVNGVRSEFFMEEELHQMWHDTNKGIDADLKDKIGTFSGSQIIKAFATGYNPAFVIVNTPRDFLHAINFSSEYSTFIPKAVFQLSKDTIIGLKDIYSHNRGKETLMTKYIEYGGGMDFLNTQGMLKDNSWKDKIINNLIEPKQKDLMNTILKYVSLKNISNYSEVGFRIAVFKRSIDNEIKRIQKTEPNIKTIGDLEKERQDYVYDYAVRQARDLMDFNQGGIWSKNMEAVVPYFNAGVQGTRVVMQQFKRKPYETTMKVLQTSVLGVSSVIALSMAALSKIRDDEDDKESTTAKYLDFRESLSPYQKANFFNIPTGYSKENKTYTMVSVAKSQGLTPMFTLTEDLIENTMRSSVGKKEKDWQAIYSNVGFAFTNNVDPTGFSGIFTKGEGLKDIPEAGGKIIAKNPAIKSMLTYLTGFDFFFEQPLQGTDSNTLHKFEGANSSKVEGFYKELGLKSGLSPVRTKAFVESFVTSPTTNPFVGIMYGGLDVMATDKTLQEGVQGFAGYENGKFKLNKVPVVNRAVRETTEYSRQLNIAKEVKTSDAFQESLEKDELMKNLSDKISKRYENMSDARKEKAKIVTEIKEFSKDQNTQERMLKRIQRKIQNKDIDQRVWDVAYSTGTSNRAKAILIYSYFGDVRGNKKVQSDLKAGRVWSKAVKDEYLKVINEKK